MMWSEPLLVVAFVLSIAMICYWLNWSQEENFKRDIEAREEMYRRDIEARRLRRD